jgi:DNA-binding transcriptional ArsR family regulator
MRVKRLDGPSLRVLAHPLRVRIVGSLRTEGPATATGLAARLGESSGLTSYHLRVLAEAGFVEPDPDQPVSGRERWWKAAHDMTSWRPDEVGDDPDARATEQWLVSTTARQGMEWLDEWLRRRPLADPAWVAVSETDDYFLDLSPAELGALLDELNAVIRRRLEAPASTADDRARVRILLSAFPG